MNQYRVMLIAVFSLLIASVLPAQAQIYKWEDKNGTVRYTDTPPPAGAKPLSTMGKKVAPPANQQPVKSTNATTNATEPSPKVDGSSPEALAKKKRELEEVAKKNKAELDAQAKKKEQNCATARTNYQTYSQGGRIYKTNENGERVYVNESELAEGAAQAQRDMQEYCS
ncbi:MAG: DUF4124 domain-containing protein [Methylophilus sp.]|nr:DUF4124 domain-containing protein [Methylophilus sp.]